jgi:hypothetical protein
LLATIDQINARMQHRNAVARVKNDEEGTLLVRGGRPAPRAWPETFPRRM